MSARVTVQFYAGAREAAGTGTAVVAARDVSELRVRLGEQFGARLVNIMEVSTLLCDGRRLEATDPLPADCEVELLPPFAGG